MSGIIDFFLIIFLLILTVYIIISNVTSILDNRLNSLKKDFVNIKCYNTNADTGDTNNAIDNSNNAIDNTNNAIDNTNNVDNVDNVDNADNADNVYNVEDTEDVSPTDNSYSGDDDVYKKSEKFGSLPNNIIDRKDNIVDYIANRSNSSTEELLESVINDEDVSKIENPNYNTYNNLPYIIDPQNANEGYYYNRVKLVTNPDSPLLKKAIQNMKKIDTQLKNCANKKLTKMRKVSGFNNYENLSEDSYANITSIGKSLLTPYVSYPLPS